jgi:HD superfamily phosphohydrolase YqeK
MTNRQKFTTAQLAELDQRLAQYDLAVDGFVKDAATQVGIDGRQVATAAIADDMARKLNVDQLASVAAIALVRLAQQQTADRFPKDRP